MAARVEIIELAGQSRHSFQIVPQHLRREGTGLRVFGAQVHGIGSVGDQLAEAVGTEHVHGFGAVSGVFLFGFASPGISGEESKCVRSDGQSSLHHGAVSC